MKTRLRAMGVGASLVLLMGAEASAQRAVPSSDATVTQISAGLAHTCAALSNGQVRCWGANESSELGNGKTTNSTVPVDVALPSAGVGMVATGSGRTCVVTANGGLKCWGDNLVGGLGTGNVAPASATPTDVFGLPAGVVSVATGRNHSCAVTTSGGLQCWGANFQGQLGDGTTEFHWIPVNVDGLSSGVAKAAAGDIHTCALTLAGGVKCWGSGPHGELGNGTAEDALTPVDVVGLGTGIRDIAVGATHTCAVTTLGAVKCWGHNNEGQLGNGSTSNALAPVQVQGLSSGARSITAGYAHTCAVMEDGTARCWGGNAWGVLGTDTVYGSTTPIELTSLGSTVSQMAAGEYHTCAADVGGGVRCWGFNESGQLGDGTTTARSNPQSVVGLGQSAQKIMFTPPATLTAGAAQSLSATATSGLAVTFDTWTPATCAISAGQVTATAGALCGIRASQAGNADTPSAPQKLAVVTVLGAPRVDRPRSDLITRTSARIAATATEAAGFTISGRGFVYARGDVNPDPRIGGPGVTVVSVPGAGGDFSADLSPLETGVRYSFKGYVASSLGVGYSVGASFAALPRPGSVSLFDGDGQIVSAGERVPVSPSVIVRDAVGNPLQGVPVTFSITMGGGELAGARPFTDVSGVARVERWTLGTSGKHLGDQVVAIVPGLESSPVRFWATGVSTDDTKLSVGNFHTCLATQSGNAKCWGDNLDGQLGNGTNTSRSSPVDVAGIGGEVVSISAGGYHTCAVTRAGGVKCWGYNGYGALGNGTVLSFNTPVDVYGLTGGVKSVSAGLFQTCAVTTAGGVKCWGNNANGQLGDGSTTQRNTPVDVVGLSSGVTSVSVGGYHACAVTSLNGIKCWGYNGYGELGDGTTTSRLVPGDAFGLAGVRVTAGLYQTCAVRLEGPPNCWGNNLNGQLGSGGADYKVWPDSVNLLTGANIVSTGSYHTCAATPGGQAKCWGSNLNGKLGDGTPYQSTDPVDVVGLSSGVASIAAGAQHSCALLSDGIVKCWGLNADGQLGDGSGTTRPTPVDVRFFVNDGTEGIGSPTISAPYSHQVLSATGVRLTWSSIVDATGYDIRVFDTHAWSAVFSGSLAGRNASSTLVSLPGGDYVFAIRACINGYGAAQCGAFRTVAFQVAPAAPSLAPAITFPTQGAHLTSSTQTLTWTAVAPNPAVPDLAYEVLLRDLTGGTTALQITVPSPDLSTIFTMKSSTSYELKVRACQAGCGPYSAPVTFSVGLPAIPAAAPSGLSCSVNGANLMSCSWSAVTNADTYQVQVIQPPPAGPGGGALTAAARQVSATNVALSVPPGAATVLVAACNGDGCGPYAQTSINAAGPNPAVPNLGTPMAGTVVPGPTVLFTWNRIPGDNGSNTLYRLFVQDLSRQSTALDVYTHSNFYSAYFRAEGARYDGLVIANPGLPSQAVGPAQGFNVAGSSATAPTLVAPAHNSTVNAGNIQLGWSPVPGATLYEYFVAILGQPDATARGVTPGLIAQVPLAASGPTTVYSGIVRACPAGSTCVAGSEAGWGPWSNAPGGPGVTNFTVVP